MQRKKDSKNYLKKYDWKNQENCGGSPEVGGTKRKTKKNLKQIREGRIKKVAEMSERDKKILNKNNKQKLVNINDIEQSL